MGKFIAGVTFGLLGAITVGTSYIVGVKRGRAQAFKKVDEELIKPMERIFEEKEESKEDNE